MSNFDSKGYIVSIGDVMLDKFYYGECRRISPEAPVPIIKVQGVKVMPGGAANTSANIASLGHESILIAPVGSDEEGLTLKSELNERSRLTFEAIDDTRGTILKARYIAQNQQLLRIDREDTSPLSDDTQEHLIKTASNFLNKANALVLSDYNKGTLVFGVCKTLIQMAKLAKIPVIVDPKGTDYSKYRGATIITPNELELEVVCGNKPKDLTELVEAARSIIIEHEIDYLALTRGKLGVLLIDQQGLVQDIPTFARDVFDVSGAGDSFVAGLTCELSKGADIAKSVYYGNATAAIAVGKSGTSEVFSEEVKSIMEEREFSRPSVVATKYNSVAKLVKEWREDGHKIGFTNGVFDLLHEGHLHILNSTKATCDKMIVAINSDQSVKRLKGNDRPIQTEELRAAVLSNMSMVDCVVIFEEDTPAKILKFAEPDILTKGGDYIAENVVGYNDIKQRGGEVIIIPTVEGHSTTRTISKIENSHS